MSNPIGIAVTTEPIAFRGQEILQLRGVIDFSIVNKYIASIVV